MIGTIGLKNLHIECIVWIYPHERTAEQPLFVDLEVDHDFDRAAQSETVSETVDYDHLAALLTKLAVERKYQLIETFAKDAVDDILARWPDVLGVRVEIRKPNAVPAAAASFVRVAGRR